MICSLSFCAGWIFKDPFVKLLLGDHKSIRAAATSESSLLQAPLTTAQEEFWAYLEQFNKLPENPTEEMIAITKTKGIAPEFKYLKTSKTSVLGDIKGLTAHREQFIKRYPWVQSLLNQYSIEIPISAERFSGTTQEIGEKYEKLMMVNRECKATPENEKSYVSNYLEGLLVVDFVYACGTQKDKRESMDIIDGVFKANELLDPFRRKLEPGLIAPASRDIGWAIIVDYPGTMFTGRASTIARGFFEYSPADKINFSKWMLNIKNIPEADKSNIQKINRGIIHNEQVKIGLLSYSIYSAHSHELGRPADSPWQIVIKILFKRLYPKDHVTRYNQYLTLLDAAYPQNNS